MLCYYLLLLTQINFPKTIFSHNYATIQQGAEFECICRLLRSNRKGSALRSALLGITIFCSVKAVVIPNVVMMLVWNNLHWWWRWEQWNVRKLLLYVESVSYLFRVCVKVKFDIFLILIGLLLALRLKIIFDRQVTLTFWISKSYLSSSSYLIIFEHFEWLYLLLLCFDQLHSTYSALCIDCWCDWTTLFN